MKFTQPDWTKSMETPVVLGLARLGPLGSLKAPGTWGSAAGILFFLVCYRYLGPVENLVATAITSYFAVGLCGEAEIRLGKKDPGEVILDEFVAMPLCFMGWDMLQGNYPAWLVLLVGFGLFRFYDIKKPWMIDTLQELPGGWGIVADDLAAALATCLTLHLIHLAWVLV